MAEQRKKLRLGELLVQQGLITTDQLSIVLAEQRHNNVPIGRLLVRLGFVTESAIRDIMARTIGQESIDLAQVVADPEALKLVSQDFARRNRVLPIAYDPADQVLTVATTEIFNVVAMDQLRAMLGPADRDQDAARERGAARGLHRPLLRLRAFGRRHPQGNRDRRDRLREPAGGGRRRRVHAADGAAGQRAAGGRGQARRIRHPFRAGVRVPAHPLPHRRRAGDGAKPAQDLPAGDHGAGEGGEHHEHRRDARAAGRAAFAHAERPADRLPRVHAAHHLRREHRAARARPREIDHQPRPHAALQAGDSTRSTSCWRVPRAS